MEWWVQITVALVGYLLGMAFAGSFLGRKWIGTVDIALHRLFKRKITTGKYLYWKYFCGMENPPRPQNLEKPSSFTEKILSKFL